MDHLDLNRWQRLRLVAANAEHDGPAFTDVQDAADRRARARITLERFRAAGPRGYASGPPIANAHPGETIMPGVGGHGPADVQRAFDSSVRELEQRVAEAEAEHQRISDRHRQCSERLAGLRQLVEACRTWANEQGVVLPGDEGRIEPPPGLAGATGVNIPEPPVGTPTFFASPPPTRPSGTPPASSAARGGIVARMLGVWS